MNIFSEPFILEDKNRLPEIYKLRYNAYKNHPLAENFDFKLSDGIKSCSDILDENGKHFIVLNNAANEIAATYRLNIIDTLEQLPYPNIFKPFQLPEARPFLFYSRLVVDEKYRNNNFANKLQKSLLQYHIDNKILFGIGTALHLVDWLKKWGFEILGEVDTTLDRNYHFGSSFAMIINIENINNYGNPSKSIE